MFIFTNDFNSMKRNENKFVSIKLSLCSSLSSSIRFCTFVWNVYHSMINKSPINRLLIRSDQIYRRFRFIIYSSRLQLRKASKINRRQISKRTIHYNSDSTSFEKDTLLSEINSSSWWKQLEIDEFYQNELIDDILSSGENVNVNDVMKKASDRSNCASLLKKSVRASKLDWRRQAHHHNRLTLTWR